MPATYRLYSSTSSTPEVIASQLVQLQGFHVSDDRITADDLTSIDILPEDEFGQKTARQTFGFTPQVSIIMIPDKFEKFEAGLDSIARILNVWLREDSSDFVLSLDDIVIAIRVHNQVTLNQASSFWTKDRLRFISRE